MGLIDIASSNSVWRGLDYCKQNKVKSYKKVNEFEYVGVISGNDNKKYDVFMDIKHPKKSKCNCLHAKDRRVICKHIVSLYFNVFPNEIDKFLREVEIAQQEYEEYENDTYDKTMKHIYKMSKHELQEALIDILEISPDWVYDRFVRDRVGF